MPEKEEGREDHKDEEQAEEEIADELVDAAVKKMLETADLLGWDVSVHERDEEAIDGIIVGHPKYLEKAVAAFDLVDVIPVILRFLENLGRAMRVTVRDSQLRVEFTGNMNVSMLDTQVQRVLLLDKLKEAGFKINEDELQSAKADLEMP